MRFSGISLVVRRPARFDNLPNIRAQTVGASSSRSLVHRCVPEAAPVNLASGQRRSDDQLSSAKRKRSSIRHGDCISRGKSHLPRRDIFHQLCFAPASTTSTTKLFFCSGIVDPGCCSAVVGVALSAVTSAKADGPGGASRMIDEIAVRNSGS
jgi:hypothetical protein